MITANNMVAQRGTQKRTVCLPLDVCSVNKKRSWTSVSPSSTFPSHLLFQSLFLTTSPMKIGQLLHKQWRSGGDGCEEQERMWGLRKRIAGDVWICREMAEKEYAFCSSLSFWSSAVPLCLACGLLKVGYVWRAWGLRFLSHTTLLNTKPTDCISAMLQLAGLQSLT